jgi:tRNA (guanosine-2'-O-)-methyltransferase
MTRGYFGIGIENNKTPANLGTLWRSAFNFEAAFLFTIHRRYPKQASDTVKAWRHVPLYTHDTFEAFESALPMDCELIGVELHERAKPLAQFVHPERAVYLLGAEDTGLSEAALKRCHRIVQIESRLCLNVAVAGSIVMWHRKQATA